MTRYAYLPPAPGGFIGSFPTRDDAAVGMAQAYPQYRGGHTAPILDEGPPISIEKHSLIHFVIDSDRKVLHDEIDFFHARIK